MLLLFVSFCPCDNIPHMWRDDFNAWHTIVSCFRQDEARVHKVTKRINTLEEVNINVKLLTEMLSHYNKESSHESDREIIKVCDHTRTQMKC